MGKIFGISNLPVSTIGNTIKPIQEMFVKEYPRSATRIRPMVSAKTSVKPITTPSVRDTFTRNTLNPNSKVVQ